MSRNIAGYLCTTQYFETEIILDPIYYTQGIFCNDEYNYHNSKKHETT